RGACRGGQRRDRGQAGRVARRARRAGRGTSGSGPFRAGAPVGRPSGRPQWRRDRPDRNPPGRDSRGRRRTAAEPHRYATAGAVVTGTLPAATVEVGDELRISRTGKAARVRSLQTLGRDVTAASAVARVAVNVRGIDRHEVRRGDALVGGAPWIPTDTVDVAVRAVVAQRFPRHAMLHVGSAAVPVLLRPLGARTLRLRLATALPLVAGDRGLLRDPGRHLIFGGVTVLDAAPAPLRGRGAAQARGAELERLSVEERSLAELRRRRFMTDAEFAPLGLLPVGEQVAGGWRADPETWRGLP